MLNRNGANADIRINGQTVKLGERDMLWLEHKGRERSLNCKINAHEDCAVYRQEGQYLDCQCGCHLVDES